jgi:hypothetical protein
VTREATVPIAMVRVSCARPRAFTVVTFGSVIAGRVAKLTTDRTSVTGQFLGYVSGNEPLLIARVIVVLMQVVDQATVRSGHGDFFQGSCHLLSFLHHWANQPFHLKIARYQQWDLSVAQAGNGPGKAPVLGRLWRVGRHVNGLSILNRRQSRS